MKLDQLLLGQIPEAIYFALLTYYDNNFVEIVELIDVDQINNISNNRDIVTIIFNEKKK